MGVSSGAARNGQTEYTVGPMARLLESVRRLFSRVRLLFRPIRQPRDWSDAEGWDAYWRAVIADDYERGSNAGSLWRDPFIERYLAVMRERGMQRVLFAGNGISLEPHALAHCGFDVTAVDVSPAACDFVRKFQLTPPQLGHFLPAFRERMEPGGFRIWEHDPHASLDRVREEHRPGGCLELVAEDLLRWSPPSPFDVLYAERAVQGFSEEVRRELARRFFAWLSPGGIAVLTTVHAPGELERRLNAELKAAGFFVHLEETSAWYRAQPWPPTPEGRERLHREYTERSKAEEARERARLDAGEKQVVLWNSLS